MSRVHEGLAEWTARVDARNARIDASPHFVYRAFDSHGLPLYIGCTLDVPKRLAQHRSQSEWSPFAETVGVWGPYPDKTAAREVESQAIETEGAYFNATRADINLAVALRSEVTRLAARWGFANPVYDLSRDGDPRYQTAFEALSDRWRAACERARARLLERTRYESLRTSRLDRYLVAREDADLARMEVAA